MKKPKPLKFISLLILQAFILQDLAFAAPVIKPMSSSLGQKPKINFSLPESVAKIEDGYQKDKDSKTIFLIQDAHTNPSGQMNIAKTINTILHNEEVNFVFTEAGEGDKSLTYLKSAPQALREKVALSYLHKGLLQGSEFLSLTGDKNFTLWGVEEKPLYVEGLEIYKDIKDKRKQALTYFNEIERTLKTLKSTIYSKELFFFDKSYEDYTEERLSLTDYFQVLTTVAKDHKISIKPYKNLRLLHRLRRMEEGINFRKANLEQQQAIEALSKKDRQEILLAQKSQKHSPFKLKSQSIDKAQAYYSLLKEKIGKNSKSKYPELFKYFAYIHKTNVMDPKEVLEEQELLEDKIYQALAKTKDQKALVKISKNTRILKNLFKLQITPSEFEDFKNDPYLFDLTVITGFLNKKIMDLKKNYEKALLLKDEYKATIQKIENFYELTYLRDKAFLDKMIQKMDEENQSKAILITGGFHAPHLKELFTQNNVNFVSIIPQVLYETDHDRYERIILSQIKTQKDQTLLAKYQTNPSNTAWMTLQTDELPNPAIQGEVVRLSIHRDLGHRGSIPQQPVAVPSSGLTEDTPVAAARLAEGVRIIKKLPIARLERSSFSPDGSKFLINDTWGEQIYVADAATGNRITHIKDIDVFRATVSSDGSKFAVDAGRGQLEIWDTASKTKTLELQPKGRGIKASINSMAFSPNGSKIVTGSRDRLVKVWDVNTGKQLLDLSGYSRGISSVSFSQDGSRILVVSLSGEVKIWDANTGKEISSFKTTYELRHGAFSPDGTKVVVAGPRVITFDIATGEKSRGLARVRGQEGQVSFAPDGSKVLVVSEEYNGYKIHLQVIDLSDGKVISETTISSDYNTETVTSTDGSRVLRIREEQTELLEVNRFQTSAARLSEIARLGKNINGVLGEIRSNFPSVSLIEVNTDSLGNLRATGRPRRFNATHIGRRTYAYEIDPLLFRNPLAVMAFIRHVERKVQQGFDFNLYGDSRWRSMVQDLREEYPILETRLTGARLSTTESIGDVDKAMEHVRDQGGVVVEVGDEAYESTLGDRDVLERQREVQKELTDLIPSYHDEIRSEILASDDNPQVLGQQNQESVDSVKALTSSLHEGGYKHTIIIGTGVSGIAESVVKKFSDGSVNVQVVDNYDRRTIDRILETIPEGERDKVHLAVIDSTNPQIDAFIDELGQEVNIDSRSNTKAYNLPLLAVGLVDAKQADMVQEMWEGGSKAFEEFKSLSSQERIKKYPAYVMATTLTRFSKTDIKVLVLLIFSKVLNRFSPWAAQIFNEAFGNSPEQGIFSGETATDMMHATGQAWRQAKSVKEKLEVMGYIALVFLMPFQKKDAIVSGNANPIYRGFSQRFLPLVHRASLRLVMPMARRFLFDVDLLSETPEDMGKAIFTFQMSAKMMEKMSGKVKEEDRLNELDRTIEANEQLGVEAEALEDGELRTRQNFLRVEEPVAGQKRLGGVIGNQIEEEAQTGSSETLNRVLPVLGRITKRLKSKVLTPYQNGVAKDHLNPDTIRKEKVVAKAAAELIRDGVAREERGRKPIDLVGAFAIGGSTFGPVQTDALGLNDGPEVKEVTTNDGEEMHDFIKRIQEAEDPETIALIVISKSGVTMETDIAFNTAYNALVERMIEYKGLSNDDEGRAEAEKIIAGQIIAITDGQVGSLRQMVRKHGWRSIDHPVLIGGRWTMWSSVGLIHYYLKGGSDAELDAALNEISDPENPQDEWDRRLQQALKNISRAVVKTEGVETPEIRILADDEKPKEGEVPLQAVLDAEESYSIEARREAIDFVQNQLSPIDGVWEGVAEFIGNEVGGFNTDVSVGLSGSYEQLVSHKNPAEAQIGSESLGKPGSRYYRIAFYGWTFFRSLWNRIFSAKHVHVTLWRETPSVDEKGSDLAKKDQAAFNAAVSVLEDKGVPYMTVETGPMSVLNLLRTRMFEYRRIATIAALYSPVDVGDEGQVGVEQNKKFVNALLLRIRTAAIEKAKAWAGTIAERANRVAEKVSQFLRSGLGIQKIGMEEIDTATEIRMDLSKWVANNWMESDTADIVQNTILGTPEEPGFMTEDTMEAIKNSPSLGAVPIAIRDFLLEKLRQNKQVARIYVDGERYDVNPSTGDLVIVLDPIDNYENLESHAANGANFDIYRIDERATGDSTKLHWEANVSLPLGSDQRVIVATRSMTQDFIFKGEEGNKRLVEHDRPGESNRVMFSETGSTLTPGGRSNERPQGYQRYESEFQRNLNTKYRFSDTKRSDFNLIMNKQGLFTAWVSWSEAIGIANSVESASGLAMIMTDEGMMHVKDLSDESLTERDIASTDQVYIFAGSPQQVRQIQVFMDYLTAKDASGEPAVLNTINGLKNIPADAPLKLKVQALVWLLRLQEGIDTLPLKGLNPESEIYGVIQTIRKEIPEAVASLDLDGVTDTLRKEYLAIPTVEERVARADEFVLLGNKSALLRFNPRVEEGDELNTVYDLERLFLHISPLKVLEAIEVNSRSYDAVNGVVVDSIARFKDYNRHNSGKKQKPKPKKVKEYDFTKGESAEDYFSKRVGITDDIKEYFGLGSNQVPAEEIAAKNRILDVYLRDQELADLSEDPDLEKLRSETPELLKLRSKRPEIFYERDGKLYVKSLHDIRHFVEDNKYDPEVNESGDVSSLLDSIFNPVLLHFLKPYVSTIISEENEDPVPGTLEVADGQPKLVLFLDPIDGSSQVEVGGVFGLIATFGLLLPDQDLAELNTRKEFKARKQLLSSFDMVFGFPRTILRSVNRAAINDDGAVGEGEVVQFELYEKRGERREFRRAFNIDPLTRFEDGITDWQGAIPVITGDPNRDKALAFAMGGSLKDMIKEKGHAHLMTFLQDELGGHLLNYTGGLVSDIGKLLAADDELFYGVVHSYAATNSHKQGRFRYWFELLHYGLMFDVLGGEVTNGYDNILDIVPPESEDGKPSGAESESIFASPMVSKISMAERHQFPKDFEGKDPSQDEVERWKRDFRDNYARATENLFEVVAAYTRNNNVDTDEVTVDDVRRAYFRLRGHVLREDFGDNDINVVGISVADASHVSLDDPNVTDDALRPFSQIEQFHAALFPESAAAARLAGSKQLLLLAVIGVGFFLNIPTTVSAQQATRPSAAAAAQEDPLRYAVDQMWDAFGNKKDYKKAIEFATQIISSAEWVAQAKKEKAAKDEKYKGGIINYPWGTSIASAKGAPIAKEIHSYPVLNAVTSALTVLAYSNYHLDNKDASGTFVRRIILEFPTGQIQSGDQGFWNPIWSFERNPGKQEIDQKIGDEVYRPLLRQLEKESALPPLQEAKPKGARLAEDDLPRIVPISEAFEGASAFAKHTPTLDQEKLLKVFLLQVLKAKVISDGDKLAVVFNLDEREVSEFSVRRTEVNREPAIELTLQDGSQLTFTDLDDALAELQEEESRYVEAADNIFEVFEKDEASTNFVRGLLEQRPKVSVQYTGFLDSLVRVSNKDQQVVQVKLLLKKLAHLNKFEEFKGDTFFIRTQVIDALPPQAQRLLRDAIEEREYLVEGTPQDGLIVEYHDPNISSGREGRINAAFVIQENDVPDWAAAFGLPKAAASELAPSGNVRDLGTVKEITPQLLQAVNTRILSPVRSETAMAERFLGSVSWSVQEIFEPLKRLNVGEFLRHITNMMFQLETSA